MILRVWAFEAPQKVYEVGDYEKRADSYKEAKDLYWDEVLRERLERVGLNKTMIFQKIRVQEVKRPDSVEALANNIRSIGGERCLEK